MPDKRRLKNKRSLRKWRNKLKHGNKLKKKKMENASETQVKKEHFIKNNGDVWEGKPQLKILPWRVEYRIPCDDFFNIWLRWERHCRKSC